MTNTEIAKDIKDRRRKLLKSNPTSSSKEHIKRREESFQRLFLTDEKTVMNHLQSVLPDGLSVVNAMNQGWKLKEKTSYKQFDLTKEEEVKKYACLSNWTFVSKAQKVEKSPDEQPIGSITEEFPFYDPDRGWNYKLSDILKMTLEQARKWDRPFPLSKAHFYDALEWICSYDESGTMTCHQTALIKAQFPYGYGFRNGKVVGQDKIEWDSIYRNSTFYPGVWIPEEGDTPGHYSLENNVRANNPEMFTVRPELYGQSEELDQQLHLAQELRDLGLSFRQIAIEMQLTEYRVRSFFGGN